MDCFVSQDGGLSRLQIIRNSGFVHASSPLRGVTEFVVCICFRGFALAKPKTDRMSYYSWKQTALPGGKVKSPTLPHPPDFTKFKYLN